MLGKTEAEAKAELATSGKPEAEIKKTYSF